MEGVAGVVETGWVVLICSEISKRSTVIWAV